MRAGAAPTPDRILPPALADRARTYLAGSAGRVVEARDAATVALLRDGGTGLEVYVLRRVSSMAFASGMHVFPGGTVDDRDREPAAGWTGSGPTRLAARLGVDLPQAQALLLAAVRETFEESGVLLAGPRDDGATGDPADGVVADVSGEDWEADRVALVERRLPFAELLDRRRLEVRADRLRAWARWTTPEFEPRRYDTAFFVAAVPEGQITRDVGGEADQVAWVRPRDLLDRLHAGEVRMLPPTAVVLDELSALPDVAAVLSAADQREITTIMPRPVVDELGARLVLPGEPGYG